MSKVGRRFSGRLTFGFVPAILVASVAACACIYYWNFESRFHSASNGWLIVLGAASLAAVTVAGLGMIGRHRRARFFKERYRANAELHELFDEAPVPCREIDANGIIRRVNRAECVLLGYAADEIVGRPAWTLLAQDLQEKGRDDVRKKLASEKPLEPYERRLVCRDGREVWVHTNETYVRNEEGGIEGIRTAMIDITQRKRADAALRSSEERFRNLFENNLNAVALHEIVLDEKGDPVDYIFLQANAAFERHTGRRVEDITGRRATEAFPGIRDTHAIETYGKVALTGEAAAFEIFVEPMQSHFSVIAFKTGERQFAAVFEDITGRKQVEEEREVTVRLLELVNGHNNLHGLMESVTLLLRDWSGCEAVAIRLKSGDDFPYFETRGLPAQFVRAESRLCHFDGDGKVVRDGEGNPVLDCMCGNVLCGRFDPAKRFFTAKGSFWTNSTTDLLAATTDADRQARTRNRCNGEGYESVALLPMRVAGDTLGLLQMNYRRRDRFTAGRIEFLERLADSLAITLAHRMANEEIHRNERKFRSYIDNAPLGIFVADKTGRFIEVNPMGNQMLGYSEGELLQLHIADVLASDDREAGARRFATVIEKGPSEAEAHFQRKDGAEFWVAIRAVKLADHRFMAFVRDITEDKRAHEALKESELRLKTLVQEAPVAISISRDGIGLQANQKLVQLLGLQNAGQFAGRSVIEYFAPERREEAKKHIRNRSLGIPGADQFESILVRPEGHQFPIHMATARIPLTDGIADMTIITDITERKRAEDALREGEARFAKIFRESPMPMAIRDMESGRYIEVNDRLLALTGYSREDVHGHTPGEVGWMTDGDDAENIRPIRTNGSVSDREIRVRLKNGGEAIWMYSAHVAQVGGKRCILSASVDITRRKEAEESLRLNEAQFRSLSEVLQYLGATTKDFLDFALAEAVRLTNSQFGYIFLYDAAKQQFVLNTWSSGAMREGRIAVPLTCYELYNAGSKEGAVSNRRPIIRNDLRPAGSAEAGPPKAEDPPSRFLAIPVFSGDRIVAVVAVANKKRDYGERDVGPLRLLMEAAWKVVEQRNAEAALEQSEAQFRQAQKMEAVGQLAGGLAHDFNNILAAVLMYLGLLQEEPSMDPGTRASLKELERDVRRGTALVRQLLAFSRRQAMEPRIIDLKELLLGLSKMLRRLLSENIELIFESPEGLPPVKADAGMLEQVVMNLCVNARDAMPRGGRLNLLLESVDISAEAAASNIEARTGRFLRLRVADTGCGMSESTLQRIFEPFFTTKDVGKGTGLGLATVYGIVKQHKGWVEVQSAVGSGTTFLVYLPASEEAAEMADDAENSRAIPGGSETVLVVEDEDSLRAVTMAALRRHGYKVFGAANSVAARRLWEGHRSEIHLLFTDQVIPGDLTGRELAAMLRADKRGLKVIICTGYSQESTVPASDKDPCVAMLQKPFNVQQLLDSVRRCLDSS